MRFLLSATLLLLTLSATAQRGHRSSGPYYGGGKHTTSHGGSYRNSYSGSSHKGGHYTGPTGSHSYGRHK